MWLMAQVWHDLLFAHWPVDAELLRPRLPAGVELDLYEGQAWLGVVPFRMSGVRARFLPALPGWSAFPELNVRTYAVAGGRRPGVFFLSLDAANAVAVAAARRFFHLPYYRAEMACRSEGDTVIYSCRRTSGEVAAGFRGSYGPAGPVYQSRAGDLDHWLTERYCLYTADGRGRALRVDIRHEPWPLQPAWARIEANTMADACGMGLPTTAPLLQFARRLQVLATLPYRA
jgi:uncharacterized protein